MVYKKQDDGQLKRLGEKELKDFREILQAKFPLAFSSESPRPIEFRLRPSKRKKSTIFRAGQKDQSIGQNYSEVGTKILSASSKIINKAGFQEHYLWLETPPKTGRDGMVYSARGMRMNATNFLSAQNEFEKLIWLYFFCDDVYNGSKTNESAPFEFVKAEEIAMKRFDNLEKEEKLRGYTINAQTRVSYSDLKKIASLMNVPMTGIEQQDRLDMYEAIKTEEKEILFVKYMKEVVVVRNNAADMSEIASKVKSALKEGYIALKDDVWVLQSKAGDQQMVLCVAKGGTQKEKELNLVESLTADLESMEKVNGLVNGTFRFTES